MKNFTISVFICCFFSTILLGQKPKQDFFTKFRQQLQLNLQNDNRASSTFLLEKIDGYEGSEFVIEPNEFPSIFQTFGYFPDYRLKNKTTKDGSSSYRQDFTYLNATDNLYSSIKTSYSGSFNQKTIDSFFYDNQKREIAHVERTGENKDISGLDSTFYDGKNKNFTTKKDFYYIDFSALGGGPPFILIKELKKNTLQNDVIQKTESTIFYVDGKKYDAPKYEYTFYPNSNVISKTGFTRDTAANSPWILSGRQNKGFDSNGSLLYETNLNYDNSNNIFIALDSTYNVYLSQDQLDYAEFFYNINGKEVELYEKGKVVYDKNQNVDSLKYLLLTGTNKFKLFAFEKYFWKEIKSTSTQNITASKLDFDVVENNNFTLKINIKNAISDNYFVQVNTIDGRLLQQITTHHNNEVTINATQNGIVLISIFDEKGNVKSKKVYINNGY